jgi:hypothetical protein
MDPVASDLAGSMGAADDGTGRFLDVTDRVAGILESFADRLASLDVPGTDGATARAAGGGFPLPSSIREAQAVPRGNQNLLSIGKIEAVDPEDAADKMARILEARNFRRFDSPVAGTFTGFSKA